MSIDVSEIPVEVMYKYLLRDYRELQEENKSLKAKLKMYAECIIDTESEEFQKLVKQYGEEYHRNVKERLKKKIKELEDELSALKSQS